VSEADSRVASKDQKLRQRSAKGFDFLGYRFGQGALQAAEATLEHFLEHAAQLYEQGRRERMKAPLLGRYVRRGLGWAAGGFGGERRSVLVCTRREMRITHCLRDTN